LTRRGRRLALIGTALGIFAFAIALGLFAVTRNGGYVFFYSPTELADKNIAIGTHLRIGGLVQAGSLEKGADQKVNFTVTDNSTTIAVSYEGLLPDLFREGQGVVAEGVLTSRGQFRADPNTGVLAKHDERYMPREVVDELKKQGRWQEGEAKP
jgi:cytochrome c-type biogenesis protein CcmE